MQKNENLTHDREISIKTDFEGLIPDIDVLSVVGQIVSGLTGAVGIYSVVIDKLPFAIKAISISIAISLTFLFIATFEGGIRRIAPYWVRQIINFLFRNTGSNSLNKIRLTLFGILTLMLAPLLIGTSVSSWYASPDMVEFATSFKKADVDKVGSDYTKDNKYILSEINRAIQSDSLDYEKKILSISNTYASKIDKKEKERKKYLSLDSSVHTWAKGSASAIKNKTIPSLKIERDEKISAIRDSLSSSLNLFRSKKISAIQEIQLGKAVVVNSAITDNVSITEKSNKWGRFLAVFSVSATAFVIVCFFFKETYRIGIEDEMTTTDNFDNESAEDLVNTNVVTQSDTEEIPPETSKKESNDNALPTSTDNDANVVKIVTLEGIPYVLYKGNKVDKRYCTNQLNAYKSKLRNNNGSPDTNNARIKDWQGRIKAIEKIENNLKG